MTILEFARAVQRLCGRAVPIVHKPLPQDDPRVRRPDITRARQVLGWEPKVDFDEGMRRSIAWFREQV
jgi:nucleoside-diphosphate-sugar epimerase